MGTAPLVFLATAATVIASQALITAAFSVTKRAVRMGLVPRMRLLHTSVRETGQICVPFVNWGLYVLIVLAVMFPGSSSKLAAAYGIAVTLDLTITTVRTFFVLRYGWTYPLPLGIAATGVFPVVDVAFFASNLLRLFAGGWFPLVIGAGTFTPMAERLRADAIDLRGFLDAVFVAPPTRVPGTAVFLSAEEGLAPNALMHDLKHNKVLHEFNLFVTVRHHEVPWIGFDKRLQTQPLGHDCWQVTLNHGFKNDPDVPAALAELRDRGVPLDEMDTSDFLSRDQRRVVGDVPHGAVAAGEEDRGVVVELRLHERAGACILSHALGIAFTRSAPPERGSIGATPPRGGGARRPAQTADGGDPATTLRRSTPPVAGDAASARRRRRRSVGAPAASVQH